jgi:hypothetical protein
MSLDEIEEHKEELDAANAETMQACIRVQSHLSKHTWNSPMNLVLGAHSQFGLNWVEDDEREEEEAENNDEEVSEGEAADLFDGLLSPLKSLSLAKGTVRRTTHRNCSN